MKKLRRAVSGTLFCVLLAGCFAASNVVLAQTAADINAAAQQAEILRRQQQEQINRDREAFGPTSRPPGGADLDKLAPKPDASAAGKVCHNIGEIVVSGASRMDDADRQAITGKFLQRCLGVSEIEQLLGEITKFYIERGLITTRAYLPAQDMSAGRLEILVIEGRVEKILLEDGGKGSIHFGNVFPVEGRLLNLRDFEQGLDQVNRLASNSASLDIRPGEKPGGSQVVIINKPVTPFHAAFTADNQGSKSTGATQLGLTLSADRLFGFNEWLMLTHRQSEPGERATKYSASDSGSIIVPFGYSTLSLTGSASEYVSTIVAASGLTLQTRGSSNSNAAKLDHVVFRDQSSRLSLAGTLTRKSNKNYLADQFLAVSSRVLTVFDLDLSYSMAGPLGVLVLEMGRSEGVKLASALEDPANIPGAAPRAQFEKYRYGYNYSLPFEMAGAKWSFTSQLAGQTASHTLYGSEQILIGGLYSVRGFVNNTLSGDHGHYVRNDLSLLTSVGMGESRIPLRLFAGLDFGRVKNRVAGIPEGGLSGAALGAAFNWKHGSAELLLTRPLSKPVFMTRESTAAWFRVTFSF